MLYPLKTKLLATALLMAVSATQSLAMPTLQLPDAETNVPIVKVHDLHNSCIYGPVTPSGTGNPKDWHRTAEAGVHTRCTPPRKPGSGELTIKPRGSGNSGQLKLSN